MNTRNLAAGIGGLILVLILAGVIVSLPHPGSQQSNQGSISTSSGSGSTTLEAIIGGTYPTATDKSGTGGVTVTVKDLEVLYVRSQTDGDWHVAVTDRTVPVFITEITPAYESSEGMPPVGSIIDETGVPFCDTYHQTESWHGDTCWEIHPVLSWHLSTSVTTTISTTAVPVANVGTNLTISYAQNPILRGSTQTITIQARDSDGPIQNVAAYVHVLYASGYTTHDFTCNTASDGTCFVSWQIGSSSTPGTFMVTVAIGGQEFDSSFEVTTA